jgi:polar amino acid transport system substrate-binding protein
MTLVLKNTRASSVRGGTPMKPVALAKFVMTLLALGLLDRGAGAADSGIAPGGALRAVYLATNPAQSVRDPATGAVRGASVDLANELAKRAGVPLDFKPAPNPPAVIAAIKDGQGDIGFVAYEATRLGTVEFSQTYMLVQQSFLVLDGSSIHTVADIDRAGQKIAGTKNDSMALCLQRVLKQATLVELENSNTEITRRLISREIDAIGGNRQRLTTLVKDIPGSRLLPDNLFDVPQNIVVPIDRPQALATVNKFIDDVRASGFLQSAIDNSGIVGIAPAPPTSGHQGCPG